MKYISNAEYGEPIETGTIYRGENKKINIRIHKIHGFGDGSLRRFL